MEACAGEAAGPSGVAVNPAAFELVTGDDRMLAPSPDQRAPALTRGRLGPGECRRGWIAFEVHPGRRPAHLVYTGGRQTVAWALP